MSKLLRRADCPVSSTGPWSSADVEAVKAWRRNDLRADRSGKGEDPIASGGTAPPPAAPPGFDHDWALMKRKGDAIKSTAQAEQETIKTKTMRGELVPADTPRRVAVGLTRMFRQCLEELVTGMPSLLHGRSVQDMRRELRGFANGTLTRLKATGRIYLAEPGEGLDAVDELHDADVAGEDAAA